MWPLILRLLWAIGRACDAALKRMEERGEELADLLTAAAEAMDKILAEGQHAESKAFACIDS